MASPGTKRVTAQDFYDFKKCPHRVYLNRNGNENEKRPHSEFLDLLFRNARDHEDEVIAGLPHVRPSPGSLEDQAISTLMLMNSGAERTYHGVLLSTGQSGIPDLLERKPGASRLGAFFYKPVDIKSGSGYEDEAKGKLKDTYGLQLYHYGMLLQQVQGFFPPVGEILDRKRRRVTYTLQDFKAIYDQHLPEIEQLVNGSSSDEPGFSGACKDCVWWNHCEPQLVRTNDLTLLHGVGRALRVNLREAGITHIEHVRDFDFTAVKVKKVGPKLANSLPRAARVHLTGQMEVIAKPAVPSAPLIVYLDFEDDPIQELVYLCGLWCEPNLPSGPYTAFFAHDRSGEAKLWQDLQTFCASIENQNYLVVHYGNYEYQKLDQLEDDYGLTEKSAVTKFRSRMVELKEIVERSVALPTRGYGLKEVAPFAGHRYSTENAGGAQAIVWFREVQKNPANEELFAKLIAYNKEDCQAMKAVCDWLGTL